MMTQEMSNAEQEYLQALVHRIATHIVEGSAAVQELKSTVARLKNERSDIEYAVYEHWLKAAKIIETAGKEKSSWEKFIKSLQMSYGDNKEITSGCGVASEKEENLLPIASKELWTHEAGNNVKTTTMDHRFVETIDRTGYNFGKKSEKLDLSEKAHEARNNVGTTTDYKFVETVDHGYHFGKNPEKFDLSERIAYDTERLAQAARTIGEPNYKTSKGKRKLEDSSELVSEGGKKKSFIRFTNGKKVDGEKVVALKKGGRCFYCERKRHRAAECKDNLDIQGRRHD